MRERKLTFYWWAVALLTIFVLTAPEPPGCFHVNRYSSDGCQTLICKDCGKHFENEKGNHIYDRNDCYTVKCQYCGHTDSQESHGSYCSKVGKCGDCGKEYKLSLGAYHDWSDAVQVGCSKIRTCTLCGETRTDSTIHVWVAKDCEEAAWCSECGVANEKITKHRLFTRFSGIVTYCSQCEYVEYWVSPVDWFLLTAKLLGIVWTVLALGCVIRERRKFYLDRVLLRSAWLENREYCVDHCPFTPAACRLWEDSPL